MEPLRERRSAQARWQAVDGEEEGVGGLVLNSDGRLSGEWGEVGWGVGASEDRSEVQCCRAALGSPN